jgi:hypothetical protein
MPPGREAYNIDALWGTIAAQLDEAKLVQLDRMRVGHQRIGLRELAESVRHAGRTIIKGIVRS